MGPFYFRPKSERLYPLYQRLTRDDKLRIALAIRMTGLEQAQVLFGPRRALAVCRYDPMLRNDKTRLFG